MRARLKDAGVAVDAGKLFVEDVEGEDSEANDNPGRALQTTEDASISNTKR